MSLSSRIRRAFVLVATLACGGVSAHDALRAPTPQDPQQLEVTPEGALRRTLAHGVYQLLFSRAQQTLYVASAEYRPNVAGGVIYKLDPHTLETTGIIHTSDKNFGLAMDPAGETLFVTNSLDISVTKIDLKTDKVTGHIRFSERDPSGRLHEPHSALYDAIDDLLYVGGGGDPGRIWVIDPHTFTVKASIANPGAWVTGLLRDPDSPRVFAANSGGEVLVIDTQSHQIARRWKPLGDEYAFLLHFALDRESGRLFVTDHRAAQTLLVLDVNTGQLRQRVPIGESLDLLYHPERRALYLTHRERGTVSILDADTYAVRRRYTLPIHPNSLALGPNGKQLFVSIKTPFTRIEGLGHYASAAESIARIDLP